LRFDSLGFELLTGLLQKALWCTVFGFQFLAKRVFPAVNGLLKTENLKFAKLQLLIHFKAWNPWWFPRFFLFPG